MSDKLRQYVKEQIQTLFESKYGYFKDKDGRVQKGDLASAWKARMASAIEDVDDQKDMSLKNVLKSMKDKSKSKDFKKVIQKKEKKIKEDEITEDDVTKLSKEAIEAKIVADALSKEAKEKYSKLKEGEAEDAAAQAAEKQAADMDVKAAALKMKAAQEKKKEADMAKEGVDPFKKKLKEYINDFMPSLLEVDEEESQEDDAFVPNHYKPEFLPFEVEQALDQLGMRPIDRYVDYVNFVDSLPKSAKIVLINGNEFDLYFDEDGLTLKAGAEEVDLSDTRNKNKAQYIINQLLVGPVDEPGEEGEEGGEEAGGEEAGAEEPPAGEEPEEETPEEEPEA